MLFQLEALELCFIHPLGFGLTSGTKRNIIVVTSAKAGGSAGPDPRQPGRERLPPARSLRAARPGAAASSRRCSAPAALRSFGSGSFWSPRPVPVPPASKKKKSQKNTKARILSYRLNASRDAGSHRPRYRRGPVSPLPCPATPGRAARPAAGGGEGDGGGQGPVVPSPPPGSGRRAGPGASRSSSRSIF